MPTLRYLPARDLAIFGGAITIMASGLLGFLIYLAVSGY